MNNAETKQAAERLKAFADDMLPSSAAADVQTILDALADRDSRLAAAKADAAEWKRIYLQEQHEKRVILSAAAMSATAQSRSADGGEK